MFSALPARVLHGRPPGARAAAAWSVVGLLMVGGILGFLLVFVPPGLVTDWQVRGTALALRDGTVTDSDCSSRDLVNVCDMTLAAPVGTGSVQRRVHYVFIASLDDSLTVQVVADPAHPGWLTTDLGLDQFWDRVASLVGITAVFAGLLLGGGWGALRSYRRAHRWRTADSVPVTLRLMTQQRVRNGAVWTVRSEDGRTVRWTVPRGSAPFSLGSTSEILGLQRVDGSDIMPLDAKLRWVDLTAAERATALGAVK